MAGTTDREQRRESVALRRMYRALARIGVDLQTVPATPREAVAIAERNIAKLSEIERVMSRRVAPTAPTPERVAHAVAPPREIEVTPGQAPAHRFEWALEGIRDRLSPRCYDAAVRLRELHLAAEPTSRIADPTAVGGSSDPSKRLALTERQEKAGREFAWIMARLDQPFRSVIRNFVLEIVKHGSERCLTINEWGVRATGYTDAAMAKAAGVATIKDALARLATICDGYDVAVREQCSATDRLMRSDLGRRAARDGWIVAFWTWCHKHGRLPRTQGEVDAIRVIHDTDAKNLRSAPPIELDRWRRRRDRLTAIAFRAADERRVTI